MAIEKEKFFEIIDVVSTIQGLNENNLLQKVKEKLYEVEKKLPEEDRGEYNKLKNGLWKDHLFSVKTSNGPVDYTLLHLAVEHTNVLIVELLLKKKVKVDMRVKDGSKDDGPTALHIAASHGHEDMIKRLLTDDQVNPLLKSKNKTPIEMVGNVENKDDIVKILKKAEQSYSPKKAKDLNIKIEGGGSHHLYQNKHKTPTNPAVNRNNATAVLENGNKQTSFNSTDESSDSTVDEQYPRVSVKNMVEKIESPQKINTTCSSKQTSAIESDGNDSDLELELETTSNISSHSEINHDWVNHVEENVLRSQKEEIRKPKAQLEELRAQLEDKQKENKSLKQKIKSLENENTPLRGELGKTKTKTNEVSLEKAGKRQFFPRVAYASLAAMVAVGAALSFTSGLPVLLIIAISAVSALTAGGITYTISKPIAEPKPDTEFKEVAIQGSVQQQCL